MECKDRLIKTLSEDKFEEVMETFSCERVPSKMLQKVYEVMGTDKPSLLLFIDYVMSQMAERMRCPVCQDVILSANSQVFFDCGHWCCTRCTKQHAYVHKLCMAQMVDPPRDQRLGCPTCRCKIKSCKSCKRKGI